MNPEEIRVECLRLANSNPHVVDVVAEAQRYLDFVSGKPVQTPREIIDAALEASGVR